MQGGFFVRIAIQQHNFFLSHKEHNLKRLFSAIFQFGSVCYIHPKEIQDVPGLEESDLSPGRKR